MTRNWHQNWIYNTGNRSMQFSEQKDWAKRSPSEMARLQFLREKQQPGVDWTQDWDNFELRDEISPGCVFQAKKVTVCFGEQLEQAQVASQDRRDAITHIWETYRLKAVLRSGKMLPYALMKKIGPKSQWKTIQKWIEAEGELPGLDRTVLEAIQDVYNQGYRGALDEIMAGDIAPQGKGTDTAKYMRQVHALDLVVKILKGRSAEEDRKW